MSASASPQSRAVTLCKVLHRKAAHMERHLDILRFQLKKRMGWLKPVHIVPFLGYGNPGKAILCGRVLEKKYLGSPCEDASWWENLKAMANRFETNEIPGVRLRACLNDQWVETQTDEEGYFTLEFSRTTLAGVTGWHTVQLELAESVVPGQEKVSSTGQVLIPPARLDFIVVSDIDDTIIKTYATDWWRMLRVTFLNNVRTRLPFEGVSAFYQALQRGPAGTSQNPIFYLSSSAWSLYDLLLDFLDLHQIPRGPLLLRDWGFDEYKFLATGHEHKLDRLEQLFAFYPDSRFVLIGDSGQEDPRLYAEAVRRHPGRVLAVYLRDVHPDTRAETLDFVRQGQSLGTDMVLVGETETAARHAAERGLIRGLEIQPVQQQRTADSRNPPLL